MKRKTVETVAILGSLAGPNAVGAILDKITAVRTIKLPAPDAQLPESVLKRRVKRRTKMLRAYVAGGWVSTPVMHRDLGPASTRPERRRAKLGRV